MGHPVQGEMQLHRGRTLQSRKWTLHLSAGIAWTNVSFSSVNIMHRRSLSFFLFEAMRSGLKERFCFN